MIKFKTFYPHFTILYHYIVLAVEGMAGTGVVTVTVIAVAVRIVAVEGRKSRGDLSMMTMMKGRVMMMERGKERGR